MNRQPAAVFIIRLITEQIEKLTLEHGDHEIKGGVRVAHNEEQGGFSVAQGIKFQIVILHQIPQFLNIEWGKSGSAANQDGLCRFAGSQLVFLVLFDCEMVRLFFLQTGEHEINGALVCLVVLPGLACVYHFQKGDEVLFFLRGLIPDIANQGTVQEAFRLDPEILGRFFTVAFGVGYDGVGKFQNILFTPQIGEWVIVHGLLKVDRVQHLVACPHQERACFQNEGSFRKRFVKIENGKVTNYFQFRNSPLSHHHALTASSCPLRCPCFPC